MLPVLKARQHRKKKGVTEFLMEEMVCAYEEEEE